MQQTAGEARVVIGDVVPAIAKAAAGADLLVLGARGVNPLRDVILGTTAERLLGSCGGPILVVRAAPQGGYRRVLAAVDLQPGCEAALRAALLLGGNATARALHVYDVPFEGMLQRAGVSREVVKQHRLRAHRAATARIAALSRAACGDPHRFVGITQHGPAAAGIVQSQQKTGADLLVLLKRARSPAEKLILGSVTRHVLADVRCDVLLVPEAKRRARAS
jgi:nucleotide-binding universal stress UspA family protein